MPTLSSIIKKYRSDGIGGVTRAFVQRLFHSRPQIHPVEVALEEILRNDDFTIVQIGPYVGNTANDPISPTIKRWSARLAQRDDGRRRIILVEPVKQYFEKLRANYADIPGAHFENVAVSDEPGTATLYQLGVDPAAYGYPEWLSQLSSLKAERINELVDGDVKRFYLRNRVAYQVECVRFSTLVERYSLKTIDLLQIDMEGYEYELLKTVDFESLPIRFINDESEVMFGKKPKCERFLRSNKYRLIDYENDTFCYCPCDRHLIERGVYASSGIGRRT